MATTRGPRSRSGSESLIRPDHVGEPALRGAPRNTSRRHGLRSGDVFVPGSRRYADPASFLLTPGAWEPQRVQFRTLVGKPAVAADALAQADDEVHTALGELEALLPKGTTGQVRLTDERYRRRISRQLDKGENLHALRRSLAYAAEGALRRRHHEQQSEQMWCLTVATNAIVCWSTEYRGLAVAALRRDGREVDDEVLAHIWPTHHENVHFYGTHSVDIDGELAQLDTDGYRPLRLAEVGPGK